MWLDVRSDPGAHLHRRTQQRLRLLDRVRVLRDQRQQVKPGRPGEVEDLGPAALAHPDETDLLEPLQRLSHGVPIDPEDAGQRSLRRKLRPDPIPPAHDLPHQLCEHLVRKRLRLDCAEGHEFFDVGRRRCRRAAGVLVSLSTGQTSYPVVQLLSQPAAKPLPPSADYIHPRLRKNASSATAVAAMLPSPITQKVQAALIRSVTM